MEVVNLFFLSLMICFLCFPYFPRKKNGCVLYMKFDIRFTCCEIIENLKLKLLIACNKIICLSISRSYDNIQIHMKRLFIN